MGADSLSAGVVGVAVLGLLAGCASLGSVRRMEREFATVSKEMEELRKLNESTAREIARTVAELKELQLGAATRVREEQETMQQLSRVEERLAETEGTIRGFRASFAELSKAMSQLAARQSGPRGQFLGPDSPERLYEAAVANLRAGEHGQAVLDFLDFIAKFPKHPLAGNAQYWIGEAYYVQRDFRQALVEFEKVIGQHGKGNKAPDALLKIGLCYKALHEPLQAREAWDKLMREFPRSEAARKARALIQDRPASATRSR